MKKSRREFIREGAVIAGAASVVEITLANAQDAVAETLTPDVSTPKPSADMSPKPAVAPSATTKGDKLAAVTSSDTSPMTTNVG